MFKKIEINDDIKKQYSENQSKRFNGSKDLKPFKILLKEVDAILTDEKHELWLPEFSKLDQRYFELGEKMLNAVKGNNALINASTAAAGVGGTVVSSAASVGALAALGSVPGLSGAGIASALATIGGTMIGGIFAVGLFTAAVPAVTAIGVHTLISHYDKESMPDRLVKNINDSRDALIGLALEIHRIEENKESDEFLSSKAMERRLDGINKIVLLLSGLIHDAAKDLEVDLEELSQIESDNG